MGDAFISMVEFRPTGLDKIQFGLKSAGTLQKSLTASTKEYTRELEKSSRAIADMSKFAKTVEFRNRVRETDQLARAQERLTKSMERQATLARLSTLSGAGGALGRAAGMLGTAAGSAAGIGLGMGIAGLSGTVPMARFQNQMERLQWELGNLLTPYLNIATKATAKAANWLGRQDVGTQNALGGGLLLGTGALAANFASNRLLGMGIGTAAVRGGGLAAGAAGMGFNALRAGGLATAASANMAYGTGGLSGLASFAAPAIGALSALTLGGGAINSTVRLQNLEKERERIGRGDSLGFYDEYAKKFSGMDEGRKAWEISYERKRLLAEGTKTNADKPSWLGGIGEFFTGRVRGTARVENEQEARFAALAQVAGEKPRPKVEHRGNQMIGGDFKEIGSTYYEAASANAKAAFERAGGETGKDSTTILQDILNLLQSVVPGSGATAQPNQTNLGNAIPRI